MGTDGERSYIIICYIYLSRIYLSYLANVHVWPGNDPRATSWCKMVADHT